MVLFPVYFDHEPLDYDGAITSMLGRAMTEVDIEPVSGVRAVLELRGIKLQSNSEPINLTAFDGEVIAITGLLGSGKSRLADIVFGLQRADAGEMFIDNETYQPGSAAEAVERGVFFSPKDRSTNAVIPSFDITDNVSLPFLKNFTRMGLLSRRKQQAAANRMIEQLGVVCQSANDSIDSLSGGNQQKIMIARWLLQSCRVLLLDEPFQGVDIGARRDIGQHIRHSANGRTTIVFVAEIDEALEIADRILVLYEHQLVGEHRNANVDLNNLVAHVSGASTTVELQTV